MERNKLRLAIAHEAARLMYSREESEYFQAKQKAAKRLCKGWVKPSDLPSNAEIRDQIQGFARLLEGNSRTDDLREMRLTALSMMRMFHKYHPKLIGSVLTGHIRQGSDVDIHLFADGLDGITHCLDSVLLPYDIERKLVRKNDQNTVYTHLHVRHRFPIELTVYAESMRSHVFKSSITGKPMERASIAQLEALLQHAYPDLDIEDQLDQLEDQPDPFELFYALLLPLENIKQHPKYHPEGDVLFHSLQVFDLACDQLPYDEEFLTAALMHDVGKGIDPTDHVQSGLDALEGFITSRTAWLIEHHMDVHRIIDGSLGARAHRRLRENESYHELLLLGECDRAGRVPGVETSSLEDALDYLRSLHDFGE